MKTFILLLACAVCNAASTITTFAGRDVRFEDDGRPGAEARIGLPRGIAADGKGNIYFADEAFSLVLKLNSEGRLSVVANPQQVSSPRGIAIDTEGNIYVSDLDLVTQTRPDGSTFVAGFSRIRKISPDHSLFTVVAGAGSDFTSEDIPALDARLLDATGIALDDAGNLYVAETGRNRVRRIGRDGKIRTIAGSGQSIGFGPPGAPIGDGGPALQALVGEPRDIAIDKDGGLLIADYSNSRVRRVDPDGIIRTVAGGGRGPLQVGTALEMSLDSPSGLAAAPDGSFYVWDWYGVVRVFSDRTTQPVLIDSLTPEPGDGGLSMKAGIIGSKIALSGMAVDAAGNLYLADIGHSRVRRVGPDGIITTVAGTAPYRFGGDDGPATDAVLNRPSALAAFGTGEIHVLDSDNCRIRRIDSNGAIRTELGNGICFSGVDVRRSKESETATDIGLGGGLAIAADARGNVYLSDGPRIRILTPDGQVRTIVNHLGRPGGPPDVSGPAIDAALGFGVFGLWVAGDGTLYLAEFGPTHRVRKVTPDGMISTFAGSGPPGPGDFSGDGGPATQARLNQPVSIAGDAAGNVYILDMGNGRIRKVNKDGIITTVAGSGKRGFAGDGGAAVEAAFNFGGPFGFPALAVDSGGNIYVSDHGNNRIRRIGLDGIITTIAGAGEAGFEGDGGPAEAAKLNSPTGLAIDSAGNLYIADSGNHRVRKMTR